MNNSDFYSKFNSEESCKAYLVAKREHSGIVCKKCGGEKHYWLEKQSLWRCANCKTCINLRAGTIMEKTHIPLLKWFECIHLMTNTKKPISALEMQRQLGMKRYEPVWYMMHKVRGTMGKRDDRYQLSGNIEVDDAFFEVVTIAEKDELGNPKKKDNRVVKKGKGDDDSKAGRGSNKQKAVLVMVESNPNPEQANPHKKNRSMGYVKMVAMDNINLVGVNYEISKLVKKESTIVTDGFHTFKRIGEVVNKHIQQVVPSKEAHKVLPWVHTVISNAKRVFLGTHHSTGNKYLQNYLNEFCYKLNRRNFTDDLFDRMLLAGANDTWY